MAIPWTGFPLRALVEKARAAVFGQIRALRELPRQEDRARPALVHALALCRGPDDRRGDQRPRLHRHRRLRQAARQGSGRADPAGDAVEIRLQIGEVDRQDQLRRRRGRQTFWETLGPDEYGFWANVNPDVPHPRWSQAQRDVPDDRRAAADAASSTATASRSPRSTRAWRKSRSTCERRRRGAQ